MTVKDKTKRDPLVDDKADEPTTPPLASDELINPDVNIEPTVITPLTEDEPEGDEPEDDDSEDDDDERAIEKSGLRFTKGLRDALNDKYEDAGIKFGERVSDAVVALADEVKRLNGQLATEKESKRQLEDEARIGRTYRTDLIEELKSEVIRAADATEDKEAKVARYARLAETADVETIKGLRDDFANAARAKFGAGRRTIDNEQPGSKPRAAAHPTTAYDDV